MKKTILLTGATGFLGSHVLKDLLDKDEFNIIVLKRRNSSLKRIDETTISRIKFYDVDSEQNIIEKVFIENDIDIVLHMATAYGRSKESVANILETNLILPISIIENAIKHNANCFINIDSYFNKEKFSYEALPNYSLSKKSLISWLKNFSSEIKIVNLVLEHVYGEFDSESKFVESMIRNIAIDSVDSIPLTHGHQRRDFVYISDVVDAISIAIKNCSTSKATFENFEVGSGQASEIKEFCELIKYYSGSESNLEFGKIKYRNDEIMESKADISKLKELGYEPKVFINEGVLKIINLYKKLQKALDDEK